MAQPATQQDGRLERITYIHATNQDTVARFLLSFCTLLILISSCSESTYQPITEDFCSKIKAEPHSPLSEQLVPVAALADSSTGVYTLEEGDASMIARAWLCGAAEKSIDIQYFIFSADNIGLIAS